MQINYFVFNVGNGLSNFRQDELYCPDLDALNLIVALCLAFLSLRSLSIRSTKTSLLDNLMMFSQTYVSDVYNVHLSCKLSLVIIITIKNTVDV